MRRAPRLTTALIALAPIGLIVALIALALTGGWGQDSNRDRNTDNALVGRATVALPLKRQVASQSRHFQPRFAVRSLVRGSIPPGRRAPSHDAGWLGVRRSRAAATTESGEEVTMAVRRDKGANFCSRPVTRDETP